MADQNTILRYMKIRAHADRGTGHEQEVARKKVAEMEIAHPELRREADTWAAHQSNAQPQAAGVHSKVNWDSVFDYAQRAFDGFSSFAENMANVQMGKALAEHVEADLKVTRTKAIIASLKLSPAVLDQLEDLNAFQREAFREELIAVLNEQITDIFNAVDGVEVDEDEEEED